MADAAALPKNLIPSSDDDESKREAREK